MTTAQLDAAKLHEMARDRDGMIPVPFWKANDAVEDSRRAYRAAVAARNDVIREARAVNVPYAALERWTGLSLRTLHDIVNGGS